MRLARLLLVPLVVAGLVSCSRDEGGSRAALVPATFAPATTAIAPTVPPTTAGPAPTASPATVPPTTVPPTTPAPTAPPTIAPGRVILVGDSVMAALEPEYTDAARKVLGAAGWNVAIDAAVNRSTMQGGQVLASLGPGPQDTVVIMLGHNDAGSPKVFGPRVEGVLQQVAGVQRVYWLTMREPRYASANSVLAAAMATHPNLKIIPWAASIQPGWTARDGLHLNGSGATGMAALILQAIS